MAAVGVLAVGHLVAVHPLGLVFAPDHRFGIAPYLAGLFHGEQVAVPEVGVHRDLEYTDSLGLLVVADQGKQLGGVGGGGTHQAEGEIGHLVDVRFRRRVVGAQRRIGGTLLGRGDLQIEIPPGEENKQQADHDEHH